MQEGIGILTVMGHAKDELTCVGSSKLPFSSRGLWFSES